jgi:hypothetical protein
MSKGELNYLCNNCKFLEAIEKFPDTKHKILHMIFKYGTSEDLINLYDSHLVTDCVLNWVTIQPILSDANKIKFMFIKDLIDEDTKYDIYKFNYKYMKFAKDKELNLARIMSFNKIGFKYIIDEFLQLGYTYDDIIKSRYNGYTILAYTLYSFIYYDLNEIVNFMNILYSQNKNLLLEFLYINNTYTILSTGINDNDLYKKIIKYIEGRKLGKELAANDLNISNILNISK